MQFFSSHILLALLCFAIVFFASACATTQPPPTLELKDSRAALRQAEQVGAREYAPLELRTAEKKLEEAQLASSKGDHERAARLAEQAVVDAELAQITALSAKAQAAVNALNDSIRALREEIQRNQRNK